MKKFIYISGIVLINMITLGAIFKTQHFPGAGILLTFGLLLFAFCFLPLAIIESYKDNGSKNKSLYISGFICAFIYLIAILLKIQHYPGAAIFMIVGFPLPFLYFLPVYIYHHNKSKEKSSMNFLGVMFFMVLLALFSSLTAVDLGKDLLTSMKISSNDFEKTFEGYSVKNNCSYETLAKSENVDKIILYELKKKSDNISKKIEDVKIELVKNITSENSSAITDNKINYAELPLTETFATTFFMRGNESSNGKAVEVKNAIEDYKKYLETLLSKNKEDISTVDALLNTSDLPNYSMKTSDDKVLSWEDSFFLNKTVLIGVIGNLNCIEANVKIAEGQALFSLLHN